jgi:hypothetical protein
MGTAWVRDNRSNHEVEWGVESEEWQVYLCRYEKAPFD